MLKFILQNLPTLHPPSQISKHLMLKFIIVARFKNGTERVFQNILCWSLSKDTGRDPARLPHFKTSYVEVYLGKDCLVCLRIRFQNILCWSLSQRQAEKSWQTDISKHLMLKFIINGVRRYAVHWNFKTSYVEVYPRAERTSDLKFYISKHLMLKFIYF